MLLIKSPKTANQFLPLLVLMLAPALNLFSVWPLTSAMADGVAYLSVGLLALVVMIQKSDNLIRYNYLVLAVLALILILVVSTALNEQTFEATWKWYLVGLFFCLIVGASGCEMHFQNRSAFTSNLANALVIGGLVYASLSLLKYYGALQLLLPWMEPSQSRLAGLWYQPNLTSTTCWLAILASAVACSKEQKWKSFLAITVVLGWVIACSASRISWLMMLGLSFLCAYTLLAKGAAEETIRAAKWLLIACAVLLVMLIVVPFVNEPLRASLVEVGLLNESSVVSLISRDIGEDSARLTELSKLLSAGDSFSLQQWLVGIGPGNYPQFSYQSDLLGAPEKLVAATWLHSHNIFTMIFVEFGLLGLLVLLTLCFVAFKALLSKELDLLVFLSVGGLGLLFIHSNLEFPLWYPWFLFLAALFFSGLLGLKAVPGESGALKPLVGLGVAVMSLFLLLNVGFQYLSIIQSAKEENPTDKTYHAISVLANDGLMGPYAILRKYRDFPPERFNIERQLKEARRMIQWQPRDLVVLREFSLLVLGARVEEACISAEKAAYRYPFSGPIMLDHAIKAEVLNPKGIIKIAECIERGLAPRGETIPSMQTRSNNAILPKSFVGQ